MQPIINYVDKGAGMAQAIRAAGHTIAIMDGIPMCSDPSAVQLIIDTFDPLVSAKSIKKKAIDAYAAALRNVIVNGTSPAEMAAWGLKVLQAERVQAGETTGTELIDSEAAVRGVTRTVMAAIVKGNSNGLTALETQISGNAGKHKDIIASMTDWHEVAAYNFSSGWPA